LARSGTSLLGRNIAGLENCTGFNNMGAGSDEGEFLQGVYSIAVASVPMKLSRQPSSKGAVVAAGAGARALGVERSEVRAPISFLCFKPSRSLSIARPNFFVLGAAKCGTTTLHGLLTAHPHICITKEKEPRFFNTDTSYNRGLDRYLRDHFRGAAGFKARGEATPFHLASGRKVRDRIRCDLGKDLRFVVILRDPVKRAWSHYLHRCRAGVETETFERALELEPTRLSAGKPAWTAYFRGPLRPPTACLV